MLWHPDGGLGAHLANDSGAGQSADQLAVLVVEWHGVAGGGVLFCPARLRRGRDRHGGRRVAQPLTLQGLTARLKAKWLERCKLGGGRGGAHRIRDHRRLD